MLHTAFSGFTAARVESNRIQPGYWQTVIHTGFWGCGAFGGNRVLMTMLQSLAADLAGVEMIFWAFDDQGVDLVRKARLRGRNPARVRHVRRRDRRETDGEEIPMGDIRRKLNRLGFSPSGRFEVELNSE